MQYANPYYDPVYQHEYYMAHRKLKGRQPAQEEPTTPKQRVSHDTPRAIDRSARSSREAEQASRPQQSQSATAGTSSVSRASSANLVASLRARAATMSKSEVQAEIERLKRLNELKREWLEANGELKNATTEDARAKAERKSLTGLTPEGRAVAKEVRDSLKAERNEVIEAHKEEMNKNIEKLKSDYESASAQYKSDIESAKNETTSRIDALRARLKNMPAKTKEKKAEEIYAEIEELQQDKNDRVDSIRATISKTKETYSGDVNKLRESHKEFKTKTTQEYEEKYLEELDKIKANPDYLKVKTSKSKGKGKGKGKSKSKSSSSSTGSSAPAPSTEEKQSTSKSKSTHRKALSLAERRAKYSK